MDERLSALKAIVQYRRKETDDWHGFDPWHTMAGFDVAGAAETYCAKQESAIWEYRWLKLAAD